jgi:GxxExxY protein
MSAEHPNALSHLKQLTEEIIGCAFNVSNALGAGFLEKVYENAMGIELAKNGIEFSAQHPLQIYYRNEIVGSYCADFLVANNVLVELKAVSALDNIHRAQCMNYLRAARLPLCLLINFGRPKVEVVRIVGQA